MEWIPNKKYDQICFSTPVASYIKFYNLVLDTSVDFECYQTEDKNIEVYIEQGLVDCVVSYNSVQYHGQDIIGLSYKSLIDILGSKPDEIGDGVEYENGEIHIPYEFDKFSLRVWFRNGVVLYVSMTSY